MFLFVLLLVGGVEQDFCVKDRVDLVEINHLYDLNGRLVINQLIFYEWDSASQRFQIRAWRLLKTNSQLPRRCWEKDCYVCHWRDMNVMRKVYADNVRETWTTYDPEVLERNMFPIEQRTELSQPPEQITRARAEECLAEN